MNLCDYYVKEVLNEPTKMVFDDGKAHIEWWEVKVSYIYDNGKEVEKNLIFNSEIEASKVSEGFHFTA